MDVKIKVDGLKEVEAQLKRLGATTSVKVVNSALFSAAKPTYDRARNNSSQWPTFKNAIRRRKHRQVKKTGKLHLSKGFRRGGADKLTGVSVMVDFKKAPHFHLLELGTDQRRTKAGANRGKVTAQNMMGRAFKGGAPQEALEIFKKRIRAQIKKITKGGRL